MRKLAWCLSISMILTGLQMPVMANTVTDSGSQEHVTAAVTGNDYEVTLSPAETYYKTDKGYPLAFKISCPEGLSSLRVNSVELSMDDGAYTSYGVKNQSSGSDYHSFYLGYLKDLSAGEHSIRVKVHGTNNGTEVVLQGSGRANYESDADASAGCTVVKEEPQYFSTKAGKSIQMPYVRIPVMKDAVTMKEVRFVHHDTQKTVWQKQYQDGLGKYMQEIYSGRDPRYENALYAVLDYDCKMLYASLDYMKWEEDIPTGSYDYVLTDTDGITYKVENCYYGTDQPYVWGVKDAKSGRTCGDLRPAINADNRGSYVSVFVYGINLDKDNIPVFVTEDEQTEISRYDESDVSCGYEPAQCEWGVYFATKKTESDQWDLAKWSVPTVNEPGEKTYVTYPVKVAGDTSEKVHSCWIDYSVQYDEISMEDGKRYMLASDWVKPGDTVKLTAREWTNLDEEEAQKQESEPLTVQKDRTGTYVFVPNTDSDTDFNSIWKEKNFHNVAKYTGADWQYAMTESDYSISSGLETVAIKDGIYIRDNYTFQIHPCNEVGNTVITGVGAGNYKNALSADQLKNLDDQSIYRVVVYRNDGSLYSKSRCSFTSTPIVRNYEITYRLEGGINNRENPDTFTNVSADIILKAPTKAGYTFEGWYIDPDYVDRIDRISCSSMGSMELFAKWRKNTSTNNNGSTSNGSNTTKTESVKNGKTGVDSSSKIKYKVTAVTKTGGNVTCTGTTQSKGKVKIPKFIKIKGKTYKVTAIAKNAFRKNKGITSVVIGDYVTSIGTSAFEGCSKLTGVTIAKNVKTIGKKAFYNCTKLKNITITTSKLTKNTVGADALKGISKNASIKVPKKQLKNYKKVLAARGVNKKAKIK